MREVARACGLEGSLWMRVVATCACSEELGGAGNVKSVNLQQQKRKVKYSSSLVFYSILVPRI
jgi:hypothetical protein